MSSTIFVNGVTLTDADWFNDVNRLHYTLLGDPPDLPTLKTTLGIGATTFVTSALHVDGTAGAPGIAWVNEPTMGIYRNAPGEMHASVGGVPVFGIKRNSIVVAADVTFNPLGSATINGTLVAQGGVYLPNSSSINFLNAANNAWWEVMHANASNTLHVGRIGWTSTTIYGGGAGNVYVHGGGVQFSGNVTGVTAAMVGLSNLVNHRQVYELRNGANAIYVGWNGMLEVQVDGTYFGRQWPIDITGYSSVAGRLYQNGSIGGTQMTFNYGGQGGQPTWLWGTNDGTNNYVWNPANFNVNYAGSAGYASNSGQVNGIGGWRYQDVGVNVAYVWATGGYAQDNYLTNAANLRVSYANSAGSASYADSTNYANSSGSTSYASSSGTSSNTQTINGASGGTVNGRVEVDRDANFGNLYPGDSWHAGQFLAQSTSSAYPCYGLHRAGVIAWDILIGPDNSLWFGASNNNGMSNYNYHSLVINGNGVLHAVAYTTNTFARSAVQPLTSSLLNVLKLRGVRCYNEEMKQPVITVDIDEDAYPELVQEVRSEAGNVVGKSVNHIGLIGPIIEAIRELNDRLTALETV